jgi:hypothetical protein
VLKNNVCFSTEVFSFRHREGRLHHERALHGVESTMHPFIGGNTIGLALRLEWREDAIVAVGEGPDGGIRSGGGSNGTKFVA